MSQSSESAESLEDVPFEPSEVQSDPLSAHPSKVFEELPLVPEPGSYRKESLHDLSLIGDDSIMIDVKEHSFKEGLLKKYVVYTVQGKGAFGAFQTARRYSDFVALHNRLVTNWPAVYIPPMPAKKAIVIAT